VGERSADDIQRDIEEARAGLARTVDQLAERTSPHRLADQAKDRVRAGINSTPGRIVIAVTGGLVVVLVIKRIRKR
jgi:hypothetical protein